MKKITRMKLINWHRFEDELIRFEQFVLISGDNGSGKTTLADAINFILGGTEKDFNSAANEGKENKRTVTTYVRLKTGNEGKAYERTGEISAHIALEIYEEKYNKYFIIGAVIDSSSETQSKFARYIIEDERLNDDLFYFDDVPKSISQFKISNQSKIKQWLPTHKDARQAIKNRLGRIDDKFFSLMTKSLGLKCIKNIKEFIYEYVLDEKSIDAKLLRDNVRECQYFERLCNIAKEKMQKLEEIEKKYDIISSCENKNKMYEYFIVQAEADILKNDINNLQDDIKKNRFKLDECEEKINELKKEKDNKQFLYDDLNKELLSDANYVAIDEQKIKLKNLKQEKEFLNKQKNELDTNIRQAKKNISDLIKAHKNEYPLDKYLKNLDEISSKSINFNINELVDIIKDTINYKSELNTKILNEKYSLNESIKCLIEEKVSLEEKLAELKKKRFTYPEPLSNLVEYIKSECEKIERYPEPRVVCELLEITDESWRNAVEGYMNTQKFNLIVMPDDFEISISLYEKLSKDKKIYTYGLINTQSLNEYDKAPEGTLATVVTSNNKYARRYANMILGKVKLCDSIYDLKKHKTSITRDCIKYQNHVISSIKPSSYEMPFIGHNAIKLQFEETQDKLAKIISQLDAKHKDLSNINTIIKLTNTEYDRNIMYSINILNDIKSNNSEIERCEENIQMLKENSGCILQQLKLEDIKKDINKLDDSLRNISIEKGRLYSRQESIEDSIQNKVNEYNVKLEQCKIIKDKNSDFIKDWSVKYIEQINNKGLKQFLFNYEKQKASNETHKMKIENEMTVLMLYYKQKYDFGAPATLEGYKEFENEYIKLKESEIITYEEKIKQAIQKAEAEFQEQFLCKLQEQIKIAQNVFKELNKTLNNIEFSEDKYEFTYRPSKEHRKYYNMIMDDFNSMPGESLFTSSFKEKYKYEIEEFFEILKNDKDDKLLDELTDYRTYLDYDLKMIHPDGQYSLYSKMYGSNSGGEAQTPFYIIIAASFMQLYQNGISDETFGLVMFDETFNNMDYGRATGVIKFFKQLPLQIIMITPPSKIQEIGGSVNETLVVMKYEEISYTEEHYYEGV